VFARFDLPAGAQFASDAVWLKGDLLWASRAEIKASIPSASTFYAVGEYRPGLPGCERVPPRTNARETS
jgi:hypothetical protein